MKYINLILVYLFFINSAIAGLPPTTLKSQSGTKATTFNFQVPHNQATAVSGAKLIESGNKNRLKNPGFESITSSAADWDIATTGTAVHGFFTESVAPIEGKQSLIFSCAGGASGGTCTLSQDVATSYALQGLASIFIESDSSTGVKFYNRVNAANSLSVNVDTITASIRKIPFVLGTTSSGLAVEITVAALQTIEVLLDEGFTGAQDLKQDVPQCTTTDCETEFSATVSSAGVVSGENLDWINGNAAVSGTSVYDITLKTGVFTVAPNCVATPQSGSAIVVRESAAATSSTLQFTTFVSSTTAASAQAFKLVCQKQGADFTSAKTRSSGSTYSSTNADTDWASCNFSTLAWTGLGTVTSSLMCKRQGSDLLMSGKFVPGTTTATPAAIPFPLWNGVALTAASSTRIPNTISAGRLLRNLSTGSAPKDHTLIVSALGTTMGISMPEYTVTNAPLTPVNGASLFNSGDTVVFENARIPINGWENSNQIVGSFNEVMTTPGVSKPVLCSAKVSSTGVLSEQKGGCFTSCTNATTPVCTFAVTWSGSPNCWHTCDVATSNPSGALQTPTTTFSGNCVNSSFTGIASARQYFCHGSIP